MKRQTSRRFEIIALVCSSAMVVLSIMPIINRGNDASLLGVTFGAFGAGAMFANLINRRKESDHGR